MSPLSSLSLREMYALLDAYSHAVADLSPALRAPIEKCFSRLVGAYLAKEEENERLRRLQAPDAHERLWRRVMTEVLPE